MDMGAGAGAGAGVGEGVGAARAAAGGAAAAHAADHVGVLGRHNDPRKEKKVTPALYPLLRRDRRSNCHPPAFSYGSGDGTLTRVSLSLSSLSLQGHRKVREAYKSRDWVLKKKESQRRQGLEVRQDSKYTARRRRRLV
jgi:hypothetical protein